MRRKQPVHNWGPWEEWKVGNGAVTWNTYCIRHCLDCNDSETARIPIICEVR